MQLDLVLEKLLQAGRTEALADIASLRELCPSMAVVQLLDRCRDKLVPYAKRLSESDRIAFIKAIAVLEHQVGGRGSVTHLERLLPLVSDPERILLDWILRNTTSYWYYAHAARSVEEYDSLKAQIASRTAERIQRDQERQARDRARIALEGPLEATRKQYNAVRRGDLKAVRALLLKGADALSLTPEGEPLVAFALRQNRHEIAATLHGSGQNEIAP